MCENDTPSERLDHELQVEARPHLKPVVLESLPSRPKEPEVKLANDYTAQKLTTKPSLSDKFASVPDHLYPFKNMHSVYKETEESLDSCQQKYLFISRIKTHKNNSFEFSEDKRRETANFINLQERFYSYKNEEGYKRENQHVKPILNSRKTVSDVLLSGNPFKYRDTG